MRGADEFGSAPSGRSREVRRDMNPTEYHEQRKSDAERRRVCLACEFEQWARTATAEDLGAAQPNADSHGGPYCSRR